MAHEIWLTFPDGSEHELRERLTIGRDEAHDLTLASKKVSREHAEIRYERGRWVLEDRGSFNGTFLNANRLQPGAPAALHHADRIGIGPDDTILFSWPAQAVDPETTEPHEEVAAADGMRLSPLQTQVVRCLCGPWLEGASLESLPSNEQIASLLGTPGAAETVKATLRRVYTKAGLQGMPAHAKRRALCRIARQRGWI
ncbi:MAG: FHA domain-containing protein [Actinobacteria bacterium]|nr:MAG: FHA domain-containing protein [Actinomycetota bacterium]